MRALIRTKRTFRHPFGKPLMCAVPLCPQLARAGHDRLQETGTGVIVRWPFCTIVHAETWESLYDTRTERWLVDWV